LHRQPASDDSDAFRKDGPMGDPGLEPGTSALSERPKEYPVVPGGPAMARMHNFHLLQQAS